MKKLTFIIAMSAVMAALTAMTACEDILAPNLSNKTVAVISPVDGTETTEGPVSFRWSALAGAEKYRVVVVSPSFAAARTAVRDTVFYQDSLSSRMSFGFTLTLAPADYQWSIQAFNYAYESPWSVYNLKITPEPTDEYPDGGPDGDPNGDETANNEDPDAR